MSEPTECVHEFETYACGDKFVMCCLKCDGFYMPQQVPWPEVAEMEKTIERQRERIAALEAEAAKLYPEVAEARSIDLVEDHFMQQYNANRALRKHLNRVLEECTQLRAIAGGIVNSHAKFYEQPQTYDAVLRRIDAEVARCYGIEHP